MSNAMIDSSEPDRQHSGNDSDLGRILDKLFAFVGLLEPDGTLLQINAAPLDAAGISAGDVIGKKLWDGYWWARSETARKQVCEACARGARGETLRFDTTVFGAEGERLDIDFQLAPLFDTNGRVSRLIASAVDITARKQQEEELRERAEEMEKLMDLVPAAVFISRDISCENMVGNQKALELYEAETDENVSAGASNRRRFFKNSLELSAEQLPMQLAAVTGRDMRDEELDVRLPSGRWMSIWGSATPLRDAEGNIRGSIGAFVESTERKRAEQALRDSERRLRNADRRKDEFLAMLAHELRNPLAPISTAVKLLEKIVSGNPQGENLLNILKRQTATLSTLVNDLLDVSRITRGLVELHHSKVSLNAVVDHALESVQSLVKEKNHEIEVTLPNETLQVIGDPVRLEQILVNLITNAAKYTNSGGRIALTLERREKEAILRVRDNGIGIDPEFLEEVFSLFGQAERGLDRSQGGLGIGLTITKTLVELHGGRIRAESEGAGRGAEFIVSLPLAHDPSGTGNTMEDEQATVRKARRILVVDDNVDAADTMALLLESLGHEVTVAYDGPEALRQAEETLPQFILLDIGLPGMDGYQVAKSLRENPRTASATIAALTGYGQPEDRVRTREADFDSHFVKPVGLETLIAFLSATARNGSSAKSD